MRCRDIDKYSVPILFYQKTRSEGHKFSRVIPERNEKPLEDSNSVLLHLFSEIRVRLFHFAHAINAVRQILYMYQ